MEQIANYLNFGRDSSVSGSRGEVNPKPSLYDSTRFFDMQEDQERKWAAETRQHEAVRVAEETGLSAAAVRGAPPPQAPTPGPTPGPVPASSVGSGAGPSASGGGGGGSVLQQQTSVVTRQRAAEATPQPPISSTPFPYA